MYDINIIFYLQLRL